MVLIDVNLLVHTINVDFAESARVQAWWDGVVESGEPIGLPWLTLVGFVRVATNPRVMSRPFTLDDALSRIEALLALPSVGVLHPGKEHVRHFAEACRASNATGNLVTDAHLAALAIEHDCTLASSDSDFAKFPNLRWLNPLALPDQGIGTA